jgi:aminoglycoside 6'-N-acetyltransferase
MSASKNLSLVTYDINFSPLDESHFPLLLKWLETPHVKEWWDEEINYTKQSIYDKYNSYTLGYKVTEGSRKNIYPFIINIDSKPVGYIQYYNFYDFPRVYDIILQNLPSSLAALDLFIGEYNYIGRGLGVKILKLFMKNYVFKKFDNCFVDPEDDNYSAIKTYERAGFEKIKSSVKNIEWFIKRNDS